MPAPEIPSRETQEACERIERWSARAGIFVGLLGWGIIAIHVIEAWAWGTQP